MGRTRILSDRKCPTCNTPFRPRFESSVYCSKKCYGLAKRGVPKPRTAKNPSTARKMSKTEAAWLAGLFEGEGSIILTNRHRAGGGSMRITIVNTFEPLIDRVAEVTGCGTFIETERDNPKHATSWTWQVYGETARDLLRQMRPWLLCKAERADAVLNGDVFDRQSRWDSIHPT